MNGVRKQPEYTEADLRHWLTWLAKQMQKHDYSLFLMEQLQPTWLSRRSEKTIYILATRMIAGFILGLATVLIHRALALSETGYSMPVLWGTIAGFSTGLAQVLDVEARVVTALKIKSPVFLYVANIALGSLFAAVGMLAIALPIDQLVFGHNFLTSGDPQTLLIAGLIPLMCGLVGVRTISRRMSGDIQSVETLGASWGDAAQGFFAGAIASFALGILYAFVVVKHDYSDVTGWFQVAIITLVGMVTGSTFHGLKAKAQHRTVILNEGIVLSVRHSLVVGLMLGLFGGGMWGICIWLQFGFAAGLRAGLFGVLGIFLISGIWFGGIDVMRHYVLRLILKLGGHFPLRPESMLKFAETELSFLKQVGGGYQFMHRYLLEHFAEGYALPADSPDAKVFEDMPSNSAMIRVKPAAGTTARSQASESVQ